ncbi:MAG: hypothetical protein EGP89_02095 [Ruminococcaceae bacterium]|nr:hypothetical protein [Oscillospiraceae bacterium]
MFKPSAWEKGAIIFIRGRHFLQGEYPSASSVSREALLSAQLSSEILSTKIIHNIGFQSRKYKLFLDFRRSFSTVAFLGGRCHAWSVTEGASETEKRKKSKVFRRFNVNLSPASRCPYRKGAMRVDANFGFLPQRKQRQK